jgi:septal ring factor EnvC (AmiA/AmiB activator)
MEIKSPFNQINHTAKVYSIRLEQVQERISELKDKIGIKRQKAEEILAKQLKSCERNMEELSNYIK